MEHMESDKLASERLWGRVEYWKQIAAIQIHFNDMCIRTRWLGLTAIATLVAAAAIAEKEDIKFRLPLNG
jgi:polyferredoxin